jgi:hypothetical protein
VSLTVDDHFRCASLLGGPDHTGNFTLSNFGGTTWHGANLLGCRPTIDAAAIDQAI